MRDMNYFKAGIRDFKEKWGVGVGGGYGDWKYARDGTSSILSKCWLSWTPKVEMSHAQCRELPFSTGAFSPSLAYDISVQCCGSRDQIFFTRIGLLSRQKQWIRSAKPNLFLIRVPEWLKGWSRPQTKECQSLVLPEPWCIQCRIFSNNWILKN